MAIIRVKRVPVTTYATWGKRRFRPQAAQRAAGTWLIRLARVGYFAKGILYVVIGGLAALAAVGSRDGETTGSHGALNAISESGVGRVLLVIIGVGLIGYALWAGVAAALDAERRGTTAKGVALRVGLAARGLAYGVLGLEALRVFLTSRESNGDGEAHWTARLLAMPMGQWIVGGIGVAIISYALYQFWRAARKNLRKRLHLGSVSTNHTAWLVRMARFGIAARGVVFLLIGWFLIRAAVRYDPAQAGGIDDSLRALAVQPSGPLLLSVVSVGLIAFGVWQIANARYREMRVER